MKKPTLHILLLLYQKRIPHHCAAHRRNKWRDCAPESGRHAGVKAARHSTRCTWEALDRRGKQTSPSRRTSVRWEWADKRQGRGGFSRPGEVLLRGRDNRVNVYIDWRLGHLKRRQSISGVTKSPFRYNKKCIFRWIGMRCWLYIWSSTNIHKTSHKYHGITHID